MCACTSGYILFQASNSSAMEFLQTTLSQDKETQEPNQSNKLKPLKKSSLSLVLSVGKIRADDFSNFLNIPIKASSFQLMFPMPFVV